MKKALALTGVILCLCSMTALPGRETPEFSTYKEMRDHLVVLFKAKKYEEAAALLESVLDRFPDHIVANTYNLALSRLYQGDAEKALHALEEGHRRKIFYGLWDFDARLWEPVRGLPGFDAFQKENGARIEAAQEKASMILETVIPEGLDTSRKHPLFIALHGGGESLDDFRPAWTSPRLRGEFITVYVQSTQVASMRGFHWQDIDIARRDLLRAYEQVLKEYPVDVGRVIIGGFSSGGYGSMAAALKGFFPVRGFVVLCPEVPATIAEEDLLAAKSRGLRGTLLTTEADNRVEQQRSLIVRMEKAGLDVRFHMTLAIGHWYPKDFESLLDQALEFVLGPEEPAVQKRTGLFTNGRLEAVCPQAPASRVLAWFMHYRKR